MLLRPTPRCRAVLPLAVLVAALTLPAGASADPRVTAEPHAATPSGFAPTPPAPPGGTHARRTPQETYDAGIARQTRKPRTSEAPGGTEPMAPPGLQQSFPGEAVGFCCPRPPDTHGAVGLSQFTEVTNTEGVSVFRKSDGVKLKQSTWPTFFGFSAQTIFDPRVVYDKVWNRWVIVAEAFPESSTLQRLFIGVSNTSDAAGGYCLYNFDLPEPGADDFFDYPQLGMDQDSIIITGNIFDSRTGPYLRSRVLAPPKAALYNCRGFSVPYFNLGQVGTVAPPIVEDDNSNAYLISWFNGTTVKLFRGTNLGRSGASVVLQANVAIPAVSAGPPMRQPAGGTLGPPTGRFQNASTQIGDALLNIHTVAAGAFPIPKWYQFDTEGPGANTLPAGRSGFFFESGTSDDSNPAIVGSPVGGTAANPIGRMMATWTSTDAVNSNAALRHQSRVKGTGRLASDPVTITGGANIASPGIAYNPTADDPERWGDYSAATLDPVAAGACAAGNRAWMVNQIPASGTLWGSRIGRMGFC